MAISLKMKMFEPLKYQKGLDFNFLSSYISLTLMIISTKYYVYSSYYTLFFLFSLLSQLKEIFFKPLQNYDLFDRNANENARSLKAHVYFDKNIETITHGV